MEPYRLDDLEITLDKAGAREYAKVSYPARYGRFSEIRTPEHLFQFNLNGEIRHIQGRGPGWPHRMEWLKRTEGNDWVYYSAGDYNDIHDITGEYYLPCPSYPSNAVLGGNPFALEGVKAAMDAWRALPARIEALVTDTDDVDLREFLARVTRMDEKALARRARALHELVGGRPTVLPPDARHVDYDVIPVNVADGCLYNCGFCRIKSGRDFTPRPAADIKAQIRGLKTFFAEDLVNFNTVFLGQHDALNAGRDLLVTAAEEAVAAFGLENSIMKDPRLLFFGSTDSMMNADEGLFASLDALPFFAHINLGLESADPETLAMLGKSTAAGDVKTAFERMLEVNRRYETIEVTANFVFAGDLPAGHIPALLDLAGDSLDRFHGKGALYLSPMTDGKPRGGAWKRNLLKQFNEVKSGCRLPTYLYLIQRL